MAKTRINRKTLQRLKKKAAQHQAADVATQVVMFAQSLTHQKQLDIWLLQQSDPMKRQKLYEFVKPHLRFASHFPTTIEAHGRIIIP